MVATHGSFPRIAERAKVDYLPFQSALVLDTRLKAKPPAFVEAIIVVREGVVG